MCGRRSPDEVAQHMCLQVVHLDEGLAEGLSETLGETYAHHQRAHESRTAGECHGIDLFFTYSRFADGTVDHGDDILFVCATGQLGHHAAVLLVDFLAGYHVA